MRKAALFIILIYLLFATACNSENNHENSDIKENPVTYFSYSYVVKDGKILPLMKAFEFEDYTAIDNAVSIHSNRFILCSDGKFIDILDSEFRRELFPTNNIIDKLNEDCEIEKIESHGSTAVKIYTKDGELYEILESTIESMAADAALSVEEFLKTYDPASLVKISNYEETKKDKAVYFSTNYYGKYTSYKVVLNNDSTVSCMKESDSEWVPYDGFPELSKWKNIVDIKARKGIIIGLQSDGKVLSSGMDFSVDNAVKIDIIDNYDIPVALTSDGKLVFGDSQQFSDILTQAESFTDIVDFTYYVGEDLVILAQKSDGSLIATTNDIYNPEYVSQP
ncbi:MAG: hypothetical protein IJE51_00935 [Clostridia bacterium]|nr:hypothetical protein [Clostridia bacterium]